MIKVEIFIMEEKGVLGMKMNPAVPGAAFTEKEQRLANALREIIKESVPEITKRISAGGSVAFTLKPRL